MRLLHPVDGQPAGALTRDDLVHLYRWPRAAGVARVRSNFVATLDGSVQGLDGRSGSINTESDHEVFALHRGLADVILVGAGTVRDEGYRAVDLEPWQTSLRAAEGLAPFPTLVVITGSLRLDPAFADPPYEHGPVIVVTTAEHDDAAVRPFLERGAEVLRSPGATIELTWMLGQLAAAGLTRVLCEGGPGLHRDLIAHGPAGRAVADAGPQRRRRCRAPLHVRGGADRAGRLRARLRAAGRRSDALHELSASRE